MNKRQLAAIAALVVSILSAVELPAEARRRYGGYRSHSVRSPVRRIRRSVVASARRSPYYQPTSYMLAQINRDGSPGRTASPQVEQPRPRRERVALPTVEGYKKLPFEGAQEYGAQGTISRSEANTLKYIDFSKGQTYSDLKSRIGFPRYRNGNTDYYQLRDGYLVLEYKDGKAYGTKTVR
jgi:hypothetical protein